MMRRPVPWYWLRVRCACLPMVLLAAACRPAPMPQSAEPPPPPAAPAMASADSLRRLFNEQFDSSAAAWTRGDFNGFLSDYAADSLTTFMYGGRPQKGIAWIREHYAPNFAAGGTRDSLRFEDLAARPLAPGVALVTARYILFRNGVTTSSGPFTLIMEERPEGWKILHDHTSPDPR